MRYFVPAHVRCVSHDDGVVLLDLRRGTYFTLNPVGAVVWSELSAHGTRDDALAALGRTFSVARQRLERDMDVLLGHLQKIGLLARGPSAAPARAGVPAARREGAAGETAPYAPRARFGPPWALLWTLRAFLTLIAVDAWIRIAGFARLHERVRRRPVRAAVAPDPAVAARISAAVDEASAYYFKRAWCLQRSAAACLLLRGRGFPARLCIGVRRMPFEAHAWVEIEDRVVNDHPRVQREYALIEQC